MPKSVRIDLTGQKFGLLTVEKYSHTKNHRAIWLCKCDCGNTIETNSKVLKNGHTSSCGCLKHRKGKNNPTHKHGETKTSEYHTWIGIKLRCYNKNNSQYKYWGGRGISVCDQWLDSFESFIADMGPKPSPKHSIDRIAVNGNYEPSNCRWATSSEQARNRRTRNISGHNGVIWNKNRGKWQARIKLDKDTHLGLFELLEEAIAARKLAEIKYWGNND
jgi:hypothetical protein